MPTKQSPIRFAVPPGQIIRDELEARGWTQEKLATEMKRPYQPINEIVNGRKKITAATAIELADAFGTSAIYWMNLQSAYELYVAYQKRNLTAKATRIVALRRSPSEKTTPRSEPRDSDVAEAREELLSRRGKTKVAR